MFGAELKTLKEQNSHFPKSLFDLHHNATNHALNSIPRAGFAWIDIHMKVLFNMGHYVLCQAVVPDNAKKF